MRLKDKLNEASLITFEELDEKRQKLVTSIVGKGNEKDHDYFDGIHGMIVSLVGQFGARSFRIKKKDLKKIMNDKNVRWVDISSIGF